MVGATGFEPATSWSQTKCSSQAELRSEPILTQASQLYFTRFRVKGKLIQRSLKTDQITGAKRHDRTVNRTTWRW